MNATVLPWTFLRQWARNVRSATETGEQVRPERKASETPIRQFQSMMEYNANLFVRAHTTE